MPANHIKSALGDYPSFSSKYLETKNHIPAVTSSMVNNVSEVRKAILAGEVEAGKFSDGSSSNQMNVLGGHLGNVVSSNKEAPRLMGEFYKYAQVAGSGGAGMFHGMGGNTVMMAPEIYSPLWLNSNINLPRDRATINAWCRSFFALNPFVHNAISLHSTYPISKLSITCPNKDIEKFFNDMIEELDLMNICIQIAQEYWLLGEAFVYAELDENKGKWSRLHIQNPDFMIVKRTVVADEPIIMLRPDENLKKIINSNRPTDIEQRKQLNQHIIDSVRRGENIPLDNFHVTHLARRISPYEIRGTGLPVCCFRQLMLFDKLYESKYVQADGMVNPLTLVKLGSADYKPTYGQLEEFRATFEQASNNKNFTIFTHDGVSVERVGWGQGIYDIGPDIVALIKQIWIGLFVPPVMMDGGADTTYANAGVALDVLRQRYISFRNMMSNWLKHKIFAPISKINDFYDYSGGEKQLIVPEIDWNHMSLFDTDTYVQTLVTLTQGQADQKRGSLHTLYRAMGLDYQDEIRKLRKENIQNAIQKKEIAALDQLDLNTLRSLSDEDEIPEPQGEQVGEEASSSREEPVPGEGGGLSDLGMPGAPPPSPPLEGPGGGPGGAPSGPAPMGGALPGG